MVGHVVQAEVYDPVVNIITKQRLLPRQVSKHLITSEVAITCMQIFVQF